MLQADLSEVNRLLKLTKNEFSGLVAGANGLDYFGSLKKGAGSERPEYRKVQIESA
jgi:hypothetical protein